MMEPHDSDNDAQALPDEADSCDPDGRPGSLMTSVFMSYRDKVTSQVPKGNDGIVVSKSPTEKDMIEKKYESLEGKSKIINLLKKHLVNFS